MSLFFCLVFFSVPQSAFSKPHTSKRLLSKAKSPSHRSLSSQRKLASKNSYIVPRQKQTGLFKELKFRPGDVIRSVDRQSIHSKEQTYRLLREAVEKKKTFSVSLVRNGKRVRIFYRPSSGETKRRFVIAKILASKHKTAALANRRKAKRGKGRSRRNLAGLKREELAKSAVKVGDKAEKLVSKSAIKANSKLAKPTVGTGKAMKPLVPEKYKRYLQRAYVGALNSFVYEKPDFDAKPLYPLPPGKKVLISRKIFRPSHNFGSFYKIFLFNPKKIVGFISEAEAISEFVKKNGKYQINPKYKLAQKQMREDKVLDISLFEKRDPPPKEKKTRRKNNKKSYVGVSLGYLGYSFSEQNIERNILAGLRLSGYNLLISSLIMDFNILAAPYGLDFFHFDILAAYPLVKTRYYLLYVMAGMKFDINYREKQNDFGPSTALSLVFPLSKGLLFRVGAKAEYGFAGDSFQPLFLSSLQISF